MAQVASVATGKVAALMQGTPGLAGAVAAISALSSELLPVVGPAQIIVQNVTPEIAEKATVAKYPSVHIYCERVVNQLREKFRTFSGQALMVVEVRVSRDRLGHLETLMQLYVEAVTRVLDTNRGDWGGGILFGGSYEVTYGPVKHGGKNLLQTAKITFALEASL